MYIKLRTPTFSKRFLIAFFKSGMIQHPQVIKISNKSTMFK